jgi:hypothetical protein
MCLRHRHQSGCLPSHAGLAPGIDWEPIAGCLVSGVCRIARSQLLGKSLVSSVAQFPHQTLPNVLEWPAPPASSTYNIRTHQEQYYSAKALSWCSTAEPVFNDLPLMLQGVFEPIGRPLVSNGETRPEAYWRNYRRLAGVCLRKKTFAISSMMLRI